MGSLAVDLGVHLFRSHDLVQHLLGGEEDMSESDLQTSGGRGGGGAGSRHRVHR
jgi:hypothetical protein